MYETDYSFKDTLNYALLVYIVYPTLTRRSPPGICRQYSVKNQAGDDKD